MVDIPGEGKVNQGPPGEDMDNSTKKVSEELKRGRRTLDFINEVKILQDWQYDHVLDRWHIQICINADIEGKIPNNSIWYVVVKENYPKGTVKIYPDAVEGCNLTFEHQSNNGTKAKNGLWRNGSLCLESQLKALGRYYLEPEPQNVDWRLWWNVKRAVCWINDANSDKLAVKGHPFELPQFNDTLPYCVISEDDKTFRKWNKLRYKYGIAELDLYKLYYITKEFKTNEGMKIHNVNWGKYLSKRFKNPVTAMWIILDEIPVIKKWQAPNSLKELINAFEAQNSEGIVKKRGLLDIIKKIIKENSLTMRDGQQHLLLLGFPIPEKIGYENSTIHWQAIKLPALTKIVINGFRDPEVLLWKKDKTHVLTPKLKLEWLKPQNWSTQKITNRGRLPRDIISMNVVVIGAGTIGASIAELIVRSGVTKISIIDDDELEIGNLSRHTLTLEQIGYKKSKKIADHLNEINPNVKADGIDKKFEYSDEFVEEMNKFDLIIDCTSEDTVLDELEKFEFKKDKIFASISIGIGAENLYLSLQKGKEFKSKDFCEKLLPYLEEDMNKFPEHDLPRDGVKCWSPTFPARYDDILLASSTAVKVLENFIDNDQKKLNVIYNKHSTSEFIGYQKVESINE